MDPERERIQADLRGLLQGDVHCDDVTLQLYASDASIHEVRPLGVVRPRSAADVVACVEYANQHQLPLHARGAGTGLAGESLGHGLILDFSLGMRRIIGSSGDTVTVQPGTVLDRLNRYLALRGRMFGPDPSITQATIGGILSVDGSGSRWLKYGAAHDRVVSLQVVLADGTLTQIGQHTRLPLADEQRPARLQEIIDRIIPVLEENAEAIKKWQPKSKVNCAGYSLDGIWQGGKLDLARLVVGSEGTLALLTEATLHTDPIPKHVGLVLLTFERMENAARAAGEATRLGASACDLMDRRLISLARESDPRYVSLLPQYAEAILLVEMIADDGIQLKQRLDQTTYQLRRRKRLAVDAHVAMEPDEMQLYWRLAKRVVPSLYRLKGTTRPIAFIEDIAVPPAILPDFLIRLQNILKRYQVTASFYAHAGHGQIHMRPFLDLTNPDDVQRMPQLAEDIYDEVMSVQGTISGEHGDGFSRSWYLRRQYGPLCDVFREIKQIFDPRNILNPGRIVGEPVSTLVQNLRPVQPLPAPIAMAAEPSELAGAATDALEQTGRMEGEIPAGLELLVPLQLKWGEEGISAAARACNGCGTCRTTSSAERMCPLFRIFPAEEATPRAKANLMRAVLSGRLAATELGGDSLKQIADLCINCHQCRWECPASVDIPKLMVEAKAQYVATNGLRASDWLMLNLDSLSAAASWLRPLANWALGNRQTRWLMEQIWGIPAARKLPRLASRSFLRRAHRRRLTRPIKRSGRKVLYFVDIYANWYDVQLADAFVRVLEHNGVDVYVHPGQQRAGMELISLGIVGPAKRLAERNVSILADAVRQGYEIVATEPSAALCLTHEYPHLVDDDDARLVAQNTSEACTYLWRMHQAGQLQLDLNPVNTSIGYHMPCHLRALRVGSPGECLLRLIPGLMVRSFELGCSGMAGPFGLKRENYRTSLRMGRGLIRALRDVQLHAGASECSTCKMQMEQGATKPTIHPLKLLALSYGLMPEIGVLLKEPLPERVLS